tara:strand:- start:66 stop:317 length:252 start_codon:yes stop_codon:yes gene_type:complete
MSLPEFLENELYNIKNADASVYGEFKRVGDIEEKKGGLSKREHFAAMALQGSMAADTEGVLLPKDHANFALRCADALLEVLEK